MSTPVAEPNRKRQPDRSVMACAWLMQESGVLKATGVWQEHSPRRLHGVSRSRFYWDRLSWTAICRVENITDEQNGDAG